MYYYGARYYDPRISIFVSVDPLAEKYSNYTPYNYTLNNPVNLIDPDGREPIKPYVGTVGNFISLLNNSPSKVGGYTGSKAKQYMLDLSKTEWSWSQMRPMPTQTGYFNMKKGRYIYTKKGGWLDMTHFLFYASKAYNYRENGVSNPIGKALQDGYKQEASDALVATHSAYSYEDLPSDYYGADFAINYFHPDCEETFGEQLQGYLTNMLDATLPENAPNFDALPTADNRETPTRTNNTRKPVYIKGDKGHVKTKEEIPGRKKVGEL
ncbi:RHS repeat-associated core domain-containing protein [Flavobacterium baculatum]